MHILAKNSSDGQFTHLKRIFDILNKRGVDCLAVDSMKSNSLHYAVESNSFELSSILIQGNINVNQINQEGHSPFSLLIKEDKFVDVNLDVDFNNAEHAQIG